MVRHLLLALLLLAGTSACEKPGAFGDTNALIIGISNQMWGEIQDSLRMVLSPRVFTVREERTFRITQQNPEEESWRRLRQFKQELVIGRASDPWVAQALERVPGKPMISPPQILRAVNVWARGQNVTIALLSPSGGAEEVLELLDPLHELLDAEYREWAITRMFVSGRDTALVDTLSTSYGFNLLVPRVYDWAAQDSVVRFRNDNPRPSELIRDILVTWRSPIPDESLGVDSILTWRERMAAEFYPYPQVVDTSRLNAHPGRLAGRDVFIVQSVWENPPDDAFPAAGPFITRTVVCPEQDRLYFLDAWLYAPGKDKYEYMIQLETILNSFRCGEA